MTGRKEQLAIFSLVSFINLEVFTVCQPTDRRHRKIVAGCIEVNALQCLPYVQRSGFAALVDPVEVEDTIGGIGGRLNLGNQQTRSDAVGGAAGKEMTLTCLDSYLRQELSYGAFFYRLGKFLLCYAFFQPFINHGTRRSRYDIPAFGLRCAFTQPTTGLLVGVDLDTQDVLSIEKFNQQRKRSTEFFITRYFFWIFFDCRVKSLASQFTIRDYGFIIR